MELDRITEQQDRSATFELIRELADPGVGEPERWEIVYALAQVKDPRAVVPLGRIGLDLDRPVEVRRAALRALEDSEMFPEGAELRAWWENGDDVVRASVLREAARGEADLLEPVLRDPNHVLHRYALIGIGATFEEPHWQQYSIAALDHPDPAIRRTVAYQLGWDEPVAAEPGLHRAATESNTEVACAAIDSLRYYSSRATLRLLHELARGDDARADAARDAAAGLLSDFEDHRSGLEQWLEPVADLLGPTVPDAAPTPGQPAPRWSKPAAPSSAEIFAMYSDPDGPWQPKLAALHSGHPHHDHWSEIPAADRSALAAFLSGHPDPQVRSGCCRALSSWNEVDALLTLTQDPHEVVRKSAVYDLRFVRPSPEIATLTWDLILSGEVASTRGREALATCAAHTPPGELDDRLIELARNDLRESVRVEAVRLLGDHIEPLLPLLAEPPLLTWAVHTHVLYGCQASGHTPPAANALRGVDNLHMAAALASLADR
ncbi:HEAT repeat domain-containing protein [Nocardia sp. NPDC059240]|uniref:HEAT repeat domain-containing protein n=1 Tax=Nocardia sp. NPDC059240 TaxID=3346786 RepID=UPI0036BBD1E8